MKAFALEDSAQLCAHLLARGPVFAPAAEEADVVYKRIEQPVAAPQPGLRPIFSPKQFFFAEREPLFAFDGRRFAPILPAVEAFALFGVSACDLTAIAYQDAFFASDPYYQRRRAAALLVGLDCPKPCSSTAFCASVDAGPGVHEAHADLILHARADGRFWLFAATQKGERALEGLELAPAKEAALDQRAENIASARAAFPHASHIARGIARINAGDIAAETWEALGLQCVACTGCTTVCPTCSCYATRDQTEAESRSVRTRFWDSCLLEGFQREASGHHPAPAAGQRVERFWVHKFSDEFRASFGRYGCVGCGRCESACPGMIGVHSTLRRLA